MSSHVNQLFAGHEMASLHIVGSVVFWTAVLRTELLKGWESQVTLP